MTSGPLVGLRDDDLSTGFSIGFGGVFGIGFAVGSGATISGGFGAGGATGVGLASAGACTCTGLPGYRRHARRRPAPFRAAERDHHRRDVRRIVDDAPARRHQHERRDQRAVQREATRSTMRSMPSASRARSRRMSLTASCMRYRPTGFVIQPTFSTPPSLSLSMTVAMSCTVAAASARMKTDLSSRGRIAWRTRSPQEIDLHVFLVELHRSRPAEIGRNSHVHGLRRDRRGLRACGRFTCSPCCIIGAVTMKMMSSTSITSTSGTTLISASVVDTRAPRPRREPFEPAV